MKQCINKLRFYRLLSGYTSKDMANMLHIPVSEYKTKEKDIYRLTISESRIICRALNISLSEIF